LFWRKEFARYRQFPLCTGSIPYKNHEKTSVLHKKSVDGRFPLWTESVVDRFYCNEQRRQSYLHHVGQSGGPNKALRVFVGHCAECLDALKRLTSLL
jgi:hypothetical protein